MILRPHCVINYQSLTMMGSLELLCLSVVRLCTIMGCCYTVCGDITMTDNTDDKFKQEMFVVLNITIINTSMFYLLLRCFLVEGILQIDP